MIYEVILMYKDFFIERLIQLRMKRGVSAREMSLSIGYSEGYMNKIENGKSFPNMQAFFYICEYLKITPTEFFYDKNIPQSHKSKIEQTTQNLEKLRTEDFDHISAIIKSLVR